MNFVAIYKLYYRKLVLGLKITLLVSENCQRIRKSTFRSISSVGTNVADIGKQALSGYWPKLFTYAVFDSTV